MAGAGISVPFRALAASGKTTIAARRATAISPFIHDDFDMLSLHKNGYERPLDWSTEMAKSFAEFQAVMAISAAIIRFRFFDFSAV